MAEEFQGRLGPCAKGPQQQDGLVQPWRKKPPVAGGQEGALGGSEHRLGPKAAP